MNFIGCLPKGKRKSNLRSMVAAIFSDDFRDRILPFDSEAARAFPKIAGSRRIDGRPMAEFDAQIAAITQSRGADLATRNVADFRRLRRAAVQSLGSVLNC